MDETRLAPKTSVFSNVFTRVKLPKTRKVPSTRAKGISAALMSAIFLGLTPVFGKTAIVYGAPPLAVVALRTLFAAMLLLVVMLIFYRPFLYIYPAGFLGCLLAGGANGLGSLFYYSALGRIDAGLGHLLYSLYPLFLIMWLALDSQKPSRLTVIRLMLALPAVYLLTQAGQGQMDIIGIVMMLIASALYALHIPINQRVLYDMPSPTVTLYTLMAMSAIVVPVFLISRSGAIPTTPQIWWPIIGLTLVTFTSRLMLFLGVKHLGGMQTALLGLSELLIALVLSHLLLGERFSSGQWIGAFILIISFMLVIIDKSPPKRQRSGRWLSWLRPPGIPSDFPWQPHD